MTFSVLEMKSLLKSTFSFPSNTFADLNLFSGKGERIFF